MNDTRDERGENEPEEEGFPLATDWEWVESFDYDSGGDAWSPGRESG